MQKFREELGQSLTFHEQDLQSEDSPFGEQDESPIGIKNNLGFCVPIDLGIEKMLVDNLLDNLSPNIDTSKL